MVPEFPQPPPSDSTFDAASPGEKIQKDGQSQGLATFSQRKHMAVPPPVLGQQQFEIQFTTP